MIRHGYRRDLFCMERGATEGVKEVTNCLGLVRSGTGCLFSDCKCRQSRHAQHPEAGTWTEARGRPCENISGKLALLAGRTQGCRSEVHMDSRAEGSETRENCTPVPLGFMGKENRTCGAASAFVAEVFLVGRNVSGLELCWAWYDISCPWFRGRLHIANQDLHLPAIFDAPPPCSSSLTKRRIP